MKKEIIFHGCKVFFANILILACSTLLYAVEEQPLKAPVNPDLLHYLIKQPPADKQTFKKYSSYGGKHPSGYIIPSPLTPIIHKASTRHTGTITDAVYDMRDPDNNPTTEDSYLTDIRNQGPRNTCWAFATYGSLESQIKKDFNVNEDFSENNLVYHHGFDSGPDDGGNIDISTAYLSRFAGPISETDDPYDDAAAGASHTPMRYIDNIVSLPVRSGAADTGYIKQAVIEHGGIFSTIFWNSNYYVEDEDFYYYSGGGDSANHAVVIVGWDDNRTMPGVPAPGAFLVRNSYGQNWGDNGYFYISYYDNLLAYKALTYFNEKENDSYRYDKVYYYDEFGHTGSVGYGNNTAYGANWFVPEKNGSLSAVGFYATSGMSYEITVYDTLTDSYFSNVLSTQTGTVQYRGWYTAKLDSEIFYDAHNGFGIVIKFVSNDPENVYPIPVEARIEGYNSDAVMDEGESFFSYDGVHWTDASVGENGNVCIKALCRESSFIVSPQTYTTIQSAVDAASDGDTIIVRDGTYHENVSVNKQVTIRSENGYAATTVVAADIHRHVFEVNAPNVTIEGFTVYGARYAYGILLRSSNCEISNNLCGYDGDQDLRNLYGIMVHGRQNSISGNIVNRSWQYGIGLRLNANNNIISNNTCNYNWHGIDINESKNNIILKNSCRFNRYCGIRLIRANENGIFFNCFGDNTGGNVCSVASSNTWQSPVPITYTYSGLLMDKACIGNYYSDHELIDSDNDGIADLAYALPGDEPSDEHPLSYPITDYNIHFSLSDDYDADGIPNTIEETTCTGVFKPDTDNDGIPDGMEDTDQDGVLENHESDPCNPDTDNDGITDGNEDTNHNGKVDITETDPCKPDSDNDGLLDGDEDINHNGQVDPGESDPRDFDTDDDKMSDKYEVDYGLNPLEDDGFFDMDGDGFINLDECNAGTDPHNPDEKPLLYPMGYFEVPDISLNLAVSDNYVFVAHNHYGMVVYDVSNPEKPAVVGSFYGFTGNALDVVVSGNHAYVATDTSGLRITDINAIDVNNPEPMPTIGVCTALKAIYRVAISGKYVFAADRISGFCVIDVSNPGAPVNIGSLDLPDTVNNITVSGNLAYLSCGTSGLYIIDIEDKHNPEVVNTYDTPGYVSHVTVVGSDLFIADGDSGIRILDISNSSAPVETGNHVTPGPATGIDVYGGYAFITDNESGLRIVNITDPDSIFETGHCFETGRPSGVNVSGNFAYVTDMDEGFHIFDITVPSSPIAVGTRKTNRPVLDVAVNGTRAYVSLGHNGLRVVDVSDPSLPGDSGFYDTAPGHCHSIASDAGYVYAGASGIDSSFFRVIDVSNSDVPVTAGNCLISGNAFDISLSGNHAYVAANNAGLRIIDIGNPLNPSEVGYCGTSSSACGVTTSGGYAYVADRYFGLRIIDITDKTAPHEIGSYPIPGGYVLDVAVSGNHAYVAAGGPGGLVIIDVSDPFSPLLSGACDTPGNASGVFLDGEHAYVADGSSGIRIINVSNARSPFEIAHYDTAGNALDLELSGNHLYVADNTAGLGVFKSDLTAMLCEEDVDGDGDVDGKDLSAFSESFSPGETPEPALQEFARNFGWVR